MVEDEKGDLVDTTVSVIFPMFEVEAEVDEKGDVVVSVTEVDEKVNLVDTPVIMLIRKSEVKIFEVVLIVLGKYEVKRWSVIIEDGKLDRDVKPGDTVIDGKLNTVDILPAVVSIEVECIIVTGFSGVFGGNIVDELGSLVEVSIADVNVIVLCTAEEDEEGNLVETLVQVVLGGFKVEISKDVEVEVDFMDGVSYSLNVWGRDAVIKFDVEKYVIGEDGKLDKVNDVLLNPVDILSAVVSEVVE